MEPDYLIADTAEPVAEKSQEALKKPKDPNLKILSFQCIICLILIVFCLISKTFFGGFFAEVKDWYNKNMNVETDISEVLNNESALGGPIESELDVSAVNTGAFILPVLGEVSSPYGYRTDPFTGEYAAHNGIDIAADKGSDILAAVGGTVEKALFSSVNYGNYIILDHNGFKTLYAHLNIIDVKVGDKVSKGQKIGECGSTGRSTGPHLHFEIRIGEKRIDPTPFLNF